MVEPIVFSYVLRKISLLLLSGLISACTSPASCRRVVDDAMDSLQWAICFLKDMDGSESREDQDERLRHYISAIREVSVDLDDAIKVFLELKGRGGIKNRIKLQQVVSEIQEISKNISKLTSNFRTYDTIRDSRSQSASASSNGRQIDRLRRTVSHVNRETECGRVIGFEKHIAKLVSGLTDRGNDQPFLSICGMAGSGKTTLAKEIYHRPEVRSHFDSFCWVFIWTRCVVRDVWEDILFKLIGDLTPMERDEIKKMRDDNVAKKLCKFLQERKCLVMMDDIWTIEQWDCLKLAFPKDKTESKILLTTRNKKVASHPDRNCFVLDLQCMSNRESWDLFEAYFGTNFTNSEDEQKKKKIATEMLKHCSGLPLAISALGRLLSTKQIPEWEMLHKNIKGHIGKGDMHDIEDSRRLAVMGILGLSYDALPYNLKQFFMILATYPENSQIRAKEVCQLWRADDSFASYQQHVNSTRDKEDIAHEFLNDLVERCMVQVGKWSSIGGRIKTCYIHGFIRELCLQKARDENYLQAIGSDSNGHNVAMDSLSSHTTSNLPNAYKIRRLAVHSNVDANRLAFLVRNKSYYHVKSLTCFNLSTSFGVLKPFFNHSLRLRVLKFENLGGIDHFPKEIEMLKLLRFLSLKDSLVKKIPSSIGNLRCLQTLDLRTKCRMEFPNLKLKMKDLRHLYLPHKIDFSGKMQFRNLPSLQTLVNVSMQHCDIDDLAQLFSLKKLKLYDNSNVGETSYKPLSPSLTHLRSLIIEHQSGRDIEIIPLISSCSQVYKLRIQGTLLKFPKEREFPPNIIKLKLDRTFLRDDPMGTLEKLPNLKILYLSKSFKGTKIVCSKEGFPQLESLSILTHHSLMEWKVEEGAFPNLRRLQIENCRRMTTLPCGLEYIFSLQEIVIRKMPTEFKRRVAEGGVDFNRIHHVPSRVFLDTTDS